MWKAAAAIDRESDASACFRDAAHGRPGDATGLRVDDAILQPIDFVVAVEKPALESMCRRVQ